MITVPVSLDLNRSTSDSIREFYAGAERITADGLRQNIAPVGGAHEISCVRRAFPQMAKSIPQTTGELARRVQQRAQQLTDANKEPEAFSDPVSHNLRPPLHAIDGSSLLIEQDYADRLDALRLLSVVGSNTRRMEPLIDDLLAFFTPGRQLTSLSQIDVIELVRKVGEKFKVRHLVREWSTSFLCFPTHEVSVPCSNGVWANLLSNAVQYNAMRERPAPISGRKNESDIIY
jgi:light-regulated signal transduction histidine kinase (bacteriophytochrome)